MPLDGIRASNCIAPSAQITDFNLSRCNISIGGGGSTNASIYNSGGNFHCSNSTLSQNHISPSFTLLRWFRFCICKDTTIMDMVLIHTWGSCDAIEDGYWNPLHLLIDRLPPVEEHYSREDSPPFGTKQPYSVDDPSRISNRNRSLCLMQI